jgi:MobC-like protein
MKEKRTNRSRLVGVRLKPEEYRLLHEKYKATTCRQLSEYIRRILFDKKITVFTRNKSMDDFMAELIVIRKELSAIENNLNQSVKKLNALQEIPEVKIWLILNQDMIKKVFEQTEEIKSKINQFCASWSQE